MTDDATEKVNTPGIVLTVVGALNAVFWLGWGMYALFAVVIGGGLSALINIPTALQSGDGATIIGTLIGSIWGPAVQSCTGCLDLVFLAGAVAAIVAGTRLRALRSPGLVRVALMALVLSPVLSVILGALAALVSFGCCGLLFGQLPTLLLLLLNVGVAAWIGSVMSDPEVAAAMEANDRM